MLVCLIRVAPGLIGFNRIVQPRDTPLKYTGLDTIAGHVTSSKLTETGLSPYKMFRA
jgi:hypothetical protein